MITTIGIIFILIGLVLNPRITLAIVILCLGWTVLGIIALVYAVVYTIFLAFANN